jgi:hypothetical protein
MSGMTDNDDRNRPERPRNEPEIIPPGRARAREEVSAVFLRIDERDGVRRVYLRRPGPFAIVLGLLALGLVAAAVFLLLAGIVLIWVPVVVAGLLVALLAVTLRRHWQRFKLWWAERLR